MQSAMVSVGWGLGWGVRGWRSRQYMRGAGELAAGGLASSETTHARGPLAAHLRGDDQLALVAHAHALHAAVPAEQRRAEGGKPGAVSSGQGRAIGTDACSTASCGP